jgi:hypothetical protein
MLCSFDFTELVETEVLRLFSSSLAAEATQLSCLSSLLFSFHPACLVTGCPYSALAIVESLKPPGHSGAQTISIQNGTERQALIWIALIHRFLRGQQGINADLVHPGKGTGAKSTAT